MKAIDIIRQLQEQLPRFTNSFSDDYSITSLTKAGTTVTAVTSQPHNLTTGDYVNILNALTQIPIINLTYVDDGYEQVEVGIQTNPALYNQTVKQLGQLVAFAETGIKHDLTQGWQEQVSIIGANENEYNGDHYLLTSPNRENFTYLLDSEPSATPATGDIKLVENLAYGYNGWKLITVIDQNTFTYQVTEDLQSPALGSPIARTQPRISGTVNVDKTIDAYTKNNTDKYWGFVVLGDPVANKDRNIYDDSRAGFGEGAIYRQLRILPFSFYVFIPSTTEIAARGARDSAEELIRPVCKSLLRTRFPTIFQEAIYSGTIYAGDAFYDYNGAYYIHRYDFEATEFITYRDTIDPERTVAFRDIYFNIQSPFNPEDSEIVMTGHEDLDDVPLS